MDTPEKKAATGAEHTVSDQNNQARIWDHFQNRAPESFKAAKPRLDFIIGQIAKRKQTARPRVLNIGAGDGYFESVAQKHGWEIYALDPNETAIQRLVKQRVKGFQGYVEMMPFESEMFDFVVASEVIEHLTDEQRARGLKEIVRVLKPDGLFLGTVPYCEDLFLNEVVCPKCGDVFNRWGHQKSFDLSDIQNELRPFFSNATTTTAAFVAFSDAPFFRKIKNLIYWIRGRLGAKLLTTSIFFSARK
ncbi:MAG: class I SAM-dependent methyltransferase [Nitrospiria bacterium]